MPWGRRCTIGCESWPDADAYEMCPICGLETERFSNLRPLEPDEARSIKSHAQFEEYYVSHCDNLGQPLEGGLPLPPAEEKKWDEKYPGGRPDNP